MNRITERKMARRESRSDPQGHVFFLQNQEYECSYSLLYFLNLKNIFLKSKHLIIQNLLNSVPSLAHTDSRKAAAKTIHTHTLGYPTHSLTSHLVRRTKAKYNCPSGSGTTWRATDKNIGRGGSMKSQEMNSLWPTATLLTRETGLFCTVWFSIQG